MRSASDIFAKMPKSRQVRIVARAEAIKRLEGYKSPLDSLTIEQWHKIKDAEEPAAPCGRPRE